MIDIKHIANAGFCIKYNDIKILVDALHNDKQDVFSVVPLDILMNMYLNVGEYKDANIILVTHYHFDHFSADVFLKYIENNSVDRIFMPIQAYNLIKKDLKNNENFIILCDEHKDIMEINFKNIKIKYFSTGHMGEQYKNIQNFGYLIFLDDKKILVTGDSDYNFEIYKKLKNEKIDIAFVNPLFINDDKGYEIIEKLDIKKICIHHVPFKIDDNGIIRNFVDKMVERLNNKLDIIVFKDENDSFKLL